jgi:hypothetical protein
LDGTVSALFLSPENHPDLHPLESLEKCSILFNIKEEENFDHRKYI